MMFKFIPKLLFVSYVLFSFISLSNCTRDEDEFSSLERIESNKAESVSLLSAKYDAEPFDCKALEKQLHKSVILDTTVIGIIKKGNGNYLKARINTDCKEKYFAELFCDEEIIEKFNRTKTNSMLIVADINRVSAMDLIIDADSLSGKSAFIGREKICLIQGDCLAILEN
ncbi:MAG TPA: hypothetical protein PLZ15_03405 [Melioribacteraceae bacterium]|nr:hypothetical protein [Melioribacteraceae bacterium]